MLESRDRVDLPTAAATGDAILLAWSRIFQDRNKKPAVLAPNGETLRTFGTIEAEAEEWAAKLRELPDRSVVAVQIGNSPAWPAIFLALLRRGHVTLPLGSDATVPRGLANAVIDSALELRCMDPAASEGRRAALPRRTTLLKLTSGTTAEPRAIRFTSAQLAADCDQICASMGITPDEVNYGAIPVAHSYGFSNLLTPLLLQGTRLVLTEDRLPRALIDGIRLSSATVFPGTPVLFQHLAQLEAATPESLRLCISAGAPLKPAIWEAFRHRFCLSIHVFYGSSECGGIAYSGNGSFPEDGFVGQPMQGVTVTPAEDGRIEVRSAAIGDGYFPEDEPETLGQGRFIPGDLVRDSPAGLVLIGRASEFINIAGRKLNPSEVERQLTEFPGVQSAVVFGVPSAIRGEEPVACIAGDAIDGAALLRHCSETLPAWQVPRDLWVLPSIPVNERGKISRRGLAEMYLAQSRNGPGSCAKS